VTEARQAARAIREKASELGFQRTGFASVAPAEQTRVFEGWLDAGMHAGMAWMKNGREKRLDPTKILPGARSIVVVAFAYESPGGDPDPPAADPLAGFVARYARGDDYHVVMGRRLARLEELIEGLAPGHRALAYVDTGPILERLWAARAGVGWVGKNALILNREMGSYFFLGVVLTTLELPPDEPATGQCGSCTLCIEACPTQAIVEPGLVDSRKCISYHTIELRGPLPPRDRETVGTRLFGCDDCQEVCPWNLHADEPRAVDATLAPRPGSASPSLLEILGMSHRQYLERFRGSAIKRATYTGLRRNAAAALAHAASALSSHESSSRERARAALEEAASPREEDSVVREQAVWSTGRLDGR